jgi:hypothetical protein
MRTPRRIGTEVSLIAAAVMELVRHMKPLKTMALARVTTIASTAMSRGAVRIV